MTLVGPLQIGQGSQLAKVAQVAHGGRRIARHDDVPDAVFVLAAPPGPIRCFSLADLRVVVVRAHEGPHIILQNKIERGVSIQGGVLAVARHRPHLPQVHQYAHKHGLVPAEALGRLPEIHAVRHFHVRGGALPPGGDGYE